VGRALFPLALVLPALLLLAPPAGLAAALLGGGGSALLLWATTAIAGSLGWWAWTYARLGLSPLWALLYPLGAAMMLRIVLEAIVRGRRVVWKGREYVTG
ncbi:MAG TPA: hypothetical protein VFZ11_06765, partial [Gemmatimonadaceae bacterium]